MIKNLLTLTWKGLRHRPLRSWLTVLGVVIGIMLVVIILALGAGIQNAITQKLQMFGTDLISIAPGKETNPFLGLVGGQKFREEDLEALESIPGIKFVEPELLETLNVEFKGEKKSTLVHGLYWKESIELIEGAEGFRLEEGRYPLNDDVSEMVLGSKAASSLFKNRVRVGDEIIVKAKRLRVVGIFSPLGDAASDNIIFMSIKIFRNITGLGKVAGSANVKIEPGANIDLVVTQIKAQLSKQEVVRDFAVITPEKANRLIGGVLSIIELVLAMLALISLVVGAVGITNTMYTSVIERTKQIGIMKAVGASDDAILSVFLIESGCIGLIGGLIGIVSGIFSAYLIGFASAYFGIHGIFSFASIDFFGLLVVLVITFITGIIAGILPARQAARMEPAEALRY